MFFLGRSGVGPGDGIFRLVLPRDSPPSTCGEPWPAPECCHCQSSWLSPLPISCLVKTGTFPSRPGQGGSRKRVFSKASTSRNPAKPLHTFLICWHFLFLPDESKWDVEISRQDGRIVSLVLWDLFDLDVSLRKEDTRGEPFLR